MSFKNLISSFELDNLVRSASKVIVQYFNPEQSDEENSVALFDLYAMETDIEFARLDPVHGLYAVQRGGLKTFPAYEAYHNGAKVEQYVPSPGVDCKNDPQLNAFIERLRDRA